MHPLPIRQGKFPNRRKLMITNICLAIMIIFALVFDLKVRKIPNYITFTGTIVGIILYIITDGFSGLINGLLGMLVGIALLLIPFSMRGIGGGDVKLLGAIGAFKGVQFVINTFLASAIFGGIIALLIILYRGKIKGINFPYGLAISIGAYLILGLEVVR